MQPRSAFARSEYERVLDLTLAGSFPASDPPPWTLGVSPSAQPWHAGAQTPAAIDVIIPKSHRSGGTWIAAVGEAMAMMATLPLAILIAGVPVAALVWGITHAVAWLTASR